MPKNAQSVSLQDVAREAGVSPSTVSRALNRPDLVAPETRKRILAVADALGYVPDQVARSLKRGESQAIGLILSDISVFFHAEVAMGVEEVVQEHGYSLILFHSQECPERERAGLELLKSYRVKGVILEPTGKNRALEEALVKEGIRVVEVDRISGARHVPSVLSDNPYGAQLAARRFLEAGHFRAAVIAGDLELTSCRERTESFIQSFMEGGGRVEEVITCPSTPEGGYEAAKRYLNLTQPPQALFVTTGQMAQGALKALKESNRMLPEDVSLIVFDDPPWAELVTPPITALRQRARDIGRRAALAVLRKGENRKRVMRIPPDWVERMSVKKVLAEGTR